MVIEGYCSVLKQHFPYAEFYKAIDIATATTLANNLSYIDYIIIDYNIVSEEKPNKIKNELYRTYWFRNRFPNF